MELTCTRCHQTVQAGDCYCPVCGLPQLVYTTDGSASQGSPERWGEAVRDASTVDWKPALRTALLLAIPTGMLCAIPSPIGFLALPLMAVTAAWVVVLYMRGQKPRWITIGAGARIGLVTGILGGWAAAAVTGCLLYGMRFWFHQGNVIDSFWDDLVNQKMSQQWASMGTDPQTAALAKAWMLSPEGRAGWVLFAVAFLIVTLLLSAAAGGALSARLFTQSRRTEN
jgi:hypothetical protein